MCASLHDVAGLQHVMHLNLESISNLFQAKMSSLNVGLTWCENGEYNKAVYNTHESLVLSDQGDLGIMSSDNCQTLIVG